MLRALSSLVLLAFAAHAQVSSNQLPPQLQNVSVVQKLNSQVPLDLEFTDDTGRTVNMRELVKTRPVVLAPVFYRCPRLCSMELLGLLKAVRALGFNAGREYDIITVSIDPRETYGLAAAKKETYVEGYGRPGTGHGWKFLTGSKTAITRLTSAVGFNFEYDASSDQFSHPAAVMILTPGGRVSRYLYGIEFSARDLRLALIEAAAGKIGNRIDQVVLYCFHYDPNTGRYTMSVVNTVRMFGVTTVFGIVGLVVFALRRDRNRRHT